MARGEFCPLMISSRNMHATPDCKWWCEFAKDCSILLSAGMFADSEICRNVFEESKEAEWWIG